MPSKLEEMQEQQEKINKVIFGDPEQIIGNKPLKWYNYVFVIAKIFTIVMALYFFLTGNMYYATIFFIAFLIDIIIGVWNVKRCKRLLEIKEMEKMMKKPKGRWEK